MSPQDELDLMNASWRSLWKQWKRTYGARCRGYVKVVELTQTGHPHLHILIDTPYIPQRAISGAWRALTGSPVVDIRRVSSSQGMARYLAKYLTKSRRGIENRRRWSQTASFLPQLPIVPLADGEIPLSWAYTPSQPSELQTALAMQGYENYGHFWALSMGPSG